MLGYFSFINFGRPWCKICKISILLTALGSILLYFWISAGNGRIWRKSEKRGFLDGQKQANMAIFRSRGTPTGLPISQDVIFDFLKEEISLMCLSLVMKCVRLKGEELHFFKIDDFFWKSQYIDQDYLFCTYSGKGFDHPNLLGEIQYYGIGRHFQKNLSGIWWFTEKSVSRRGRSTKIAAALTPPWVHFLEQP